VREGAQTQSADAAVSAPDRLDDVFELARGDAPLVISFPHAGTEIPADIAARLTPAALERADTDWHLPRLYDFAGELGATTLAARYSRYVIDLNRPPQDTSLYPGQDTTALVPIDTFRKQPLYRQGQVPDADEIAARRARWWHPYHAALEQEIERLKARHGRVVLWDAHSIASMLPRFFDGKLPDLNLGTVGGGSCDARVQTAVEAVLAAQREYTWVANGRFKGGYITRHYGRPQDGVHALQLEMCQSTYMNESAPFEFRVDLAVRLRPLLRRLLEAVLRAVPAAAG
jgi:N-formylglutamate deformylase